MSEKWIKARLGDVAYVEMGQSPDSSGYNSEGAGIPLIQGNADIKNRKTIKRVCTTSITKTAEAGKIIVTVRAPVGNVAIATERCCLGRGVCSVSPLQNSGVRGMPALPNAAGDGTPALPNGGMM